MKLHQIPVNTLVELQFNYLGINYRVKSALLYKLDTTVYFSAIKSAGKTIPATKLKNIMLIYRENGNIFLFKELPLRSISYNGQKLYAIPSDIEAQKVKLKNTYRLFIGAPIAARIILPDETNRNINCILKDISMVGMGIICREKIDQLSLIQISFRVNEETNEELVASINQEYEFKNGTGYFYSCEFKEPSETIGKFVARHYEKMSQTKTN
jgi:hypothetical protein